MIQQSFMLLALSIIGLLARSLYNVFLHPLRNYPGPFLCRANFLKWMLVQCQGESSNYLQELHKKYGNVIRMEPNSLSFIDSQAWQDIYGHKIGHRTGANPNQPPNGNLPKSSYAVRTNANGYADIVSLERKTLGGIFFQQSFVANRFVCRSMFPPRLIIDGCEG